QLPIAPASSAQHEESDPRMIPRLHEEAAAPVAATRHRLHALAVDFDIGIAVAVPLPTVGAADRRRDRLAEHLGQWPTEAPQQRKREAIDADVVVFPMGAGLLKRARRSLLCARLVAEVAVTVDEIGLVPERPLPLRGVVEELP